ncbi:hypothetical protein HK097_005276, partial [Rhizophlyctis rosea]
MVRYLSSLNEIDTPWLLNASLSGPLMPAGEGADLGSGSNPFNQAYVSEIVNKQGPLRVNDVSSAAPIVLINDNGTVTPQLCHDETLLVSADGELGVNADSMKFDFKAPLKLEEDQTDRLGGTVSLLLDGDDFGVEGGKLDLKETTYKGFGSVKIGGLSDVDFLDQVISDDDLNLPKVKGVRIQTSDDFTQLSGKLSIRPRGLGQIPYYTLSGLGADEGLYYNSVSNTLSVNSILLQRSFVLSPNHAVTQAYLAQFIQAMPGGGIDVLPEVQGTGRREIRVRVDPSGCIMNDPSMGGALDIRCDGIGIVKKAGVLSLNLIGDEDGDVAVTGNSIRSLLSFNAPLVKTGNVVSLQLTVEAPDLTLTPGGLLTCNIDAAPAGGLVKAGSLFSLAKDITDKVDDAAQKADQAAEAADAAKTAGNAAQTTADAAANTASQAAKTA